MRPLRNCGGGDLLALAATHPARYPCLLESVALGTAQARYDILFACPQDAIALHHDGRVRNAQGRELDGTFLDVLDAHWRARRGTPDRSAKQPANLPFAGGHALFLGYELAAQIEPRLQLPPAPETSIPVALALHCPCAILRDHATQKFHIVSEPDFAELAVSLQADLEAIPAFVPTPPGDCKITEDAAQHFLDAVARVHEHLRAGDTYQVNLSREWRAEFARTPGVADVYASLRRTNPAPFAGLLQWQDWAVLSSSPERLVQVRGDHVQTRPIAGTCARSATGDDATRIRKMMAHPKERAEHVMLIDLQRNDLGRVCVPGSVQVDELMSVESYAHVHHIVSNVCGKLRGDITPGAIIAALFPGGTITGCPKVRCMQIIAELEGVGRGAYTGALGYLDCDGSMDLNILIRSLTAHGTQVRFRAGAGIVADSDAPSELAETRAKARGLVKALSGC
ncbi:MAG TPA: aminodeoxychorismate synthase component I [Rudaea sp.]|nr:aminodeoxychorismate synthase component I [Rudaea sp.]